MPSTLCMTNIDKYPGFEIIIWVIIKARWRMWKKTTWSCWKKTLLRCVCVCSRDPETGTLHTHLIGTFVVAWSTRMNSSLKMKRGPACFGVWATCGNAAFTALPRMIAFRQRGLVCMPLPDLPQTQSCSTWEPMFCFCFPSRSQASREYQELKVPGCLLLNAARFDLMPRMSYTAVPRLRNVFFIRKMISLIFLFREIGLQSFRL